MVIPLPRCSRDRGQGCVHRHSNTMATSLTLKKDRSIPLTRMVREQLSVTILLCPSLWLSTTGSNRSLLHGVFAQPMESVCNPTQETAIIFWWIFHYCLWLCSWGYIYIYYWTVYTSEQSKAEQCLQSKVNDMFLFQTKFVGINLLAERCHRKAKPC